MMKAIAIIALALGLEVGFLLTAAIPAHRPEAPRAEIANTNAGAPAPTKGVSVQARSLPPGRS